jgi:hypothetical protein
MTGSGIPPAAGGMSGSGIPAPARPGRTAGVEQTFRITPA